VRKLADLKPPRRKEQEERHQQVLPLGLCCKKSRDNTMDVLLLLLLGLSRHSKQAGDEGDLPDDVSFTHASHLSLAKHVHHLIPL